MLIKKSGAGTGGATKAIFRDINDAFLSYTYTDISTSFFENASSSFSQYKSKMVFKPLDIEKDPVEQGYVEGAYDLVIAFFVIHATSDLENSLRNIRKLVKPGGYLVLGEASESGTGAATSGFIFGTLPGWWVGTDKGRVSTPLVSQKTWDSLLRSTGFSGAEEAPPISIEGIFNIFPVISQAVNSYVNFLREPLSAGSLPNNVGIAKVKKLILIGGLTTRSSHLVEGLETTLGRGFAIEVHRFKNLEDVDFNILDANSAVISMADLDSPIFKDITPERFGALKRIFDSEKVIVWVTSGRLCDEPFHNMTVAFGRVATHEMPDLRLQHLDISDPEKTNPKTVAEAFLRIYAAVSWKNNANVLWTMEPEIVVDRDGRQLVPRLNFIPELNDRYNAGRWPIVREVNIKKLTVSVELQPSQNDGYLLREQSTYEGELLEYNHGKQDLLELHTTHAIISALWTPFGHRFLVIGEELKTGIPYLALVPSLVSILKVSPKCAVTGKVHGLSSEYILRGVAAHLISIVALDSLSNGQTLMVHNAPRIVADALARQAAAKDVDVTYTTDSTEEVPISWIKLPPYLSHLDFEEILGSKSSPATFMGLSNHKIKKSENEMTIIATLDSQCHTMITAQSVYSHTAGGRNNDHSISDAAVGNRLGKALEYMQQQWGGDIEDNTLSSISATELVSLRDLATGSCPLDPLSIIDWTDTAPLPVNATRLDDCPIFKGTKSTYWIVGMSGALGIALADWMIRKGARSLVMSSRNPDISPDWVTSHRLRGATVTVIICDVTNEISLNEVHRNICEMLPPIVGVIHGAMVLRDASIRNMSFEQLTEVIRPKVNGSIYLDQIFRDIDLDFFVLTSSINTVIGNLGQANYAAANAFMASIAAQRRKRGLRASAVNGGAIIGAGYMEREARRAWDRIAQNNFMMRLSEEDFVQSICEAIHQSRLDSPYGPEISTGLNLVPFNVPNPPFWSSDPKFSNFVVHQETKATGQVQGPTAASSGTAYVQDLLKKCQSQQEVHGIVKRKKTLQNNLASMLTR